MLKHLSSFPYVPVAESLVSSSMLISKGHVNDPVMADFKQWGLGTVAFKPYTIDELIEHDKILGIT